MAEALNQRDKTAGAAVRVTVWTELQHMPFSLLVCDDFSGYKASFGAGVTGIGCMAHARRKFYDLPANNKSQIAEQALGFIGCSPRTTRVRSAPFPTDILRTLLTRQATKPDRTDLFPN
jgi:hypothetical protein